MSAQTIARSADKVVLLDPSEKLRPEPVYAGKLQSDFRNYTIDFDDPIKERVRNTYEKMHANQTVEFVKFDRHCDQFALWRVKRERGKGCKKVHKHFEIIGKFYLNSNYNFFRFNQQKLKIMIAVSAARMKNWLQFNKVKMSVKDALIKLNDLVDESDPDTTMPNIVHAFQTAESIRKVHPDMDWFHLTGLIHDLGKIMAFYGEPQWAVVGDTFPVGCAWGDSIVYRDTSFDDNPDGKDSRYNTKYGIYKPKCGISNLLMSWGHDEYLYRILVHNKSTLPKEALAMIRFHSFYPWHAGGDYMHFCTAEDTEMLKWVIEFNKFDLYTKSDDLPDIEKLWPYYEKLIEKYIPGVIEW